MLAAIIQSSDAAIISKTLDGIVTSWNPSAETLFGYSAAEIVGKPIQVIAAPSHPGEMVEILNRIRRGERVEHYETERRRKDADASFRSRSPYLLSMTRAAGSLAPPRSRVTSRFERRQKRS